MDQIPPVIPVENVPASTPPVQAPMPHPTDDHSLVETPLKPKKPFDLRYVFVTIIVLALVAGIIAVVWRPKEEAPAPTPTPTLTPTPIKRVTVPLATQSAYLNLVAGAASLSSSINTLQVNDTTLSPPTIELSLGFPN